MGLGKVFQLFFFLFFCQLFGSHWNLFVDLRGGEAVLGDGVHVPRLQLQQQQISKQLQQAQS